MVIFRNDDINPSTDFNNVKKQYNVIRELVPDVEIWQGVTLFGKENKKGSVYADTPFKDKPTDWFFDIDNYYSHKSCNLSDKQCSHGLFHADHTRMSRDAQAMSIIGSCKILKSDTFLPPFNRYNGETKLICKENGIHMITKTGWKNLIFNDFDPNHKLWYWHSWEWSAKALESKLCLK